MYWLFGLFIIGCGFTHFMECVTSVSPMYRLAGTLKLVTALASWGTVIALARVAPLALSMRMPEELEREISARREAEAALHAAKEELEARVLERTRELTSANAILQAEVAERQRAEAALQRHQEDIEALNARLRRAMQETHHRVKNNLQVICALVDIQSADGREVVPVAELRRVGQHARSLSAIHDLLTRQAKAESELEEVSSKAILGQLMPILREVMEGREIRAEVEDARLPLRVGSSLAILVNELVSNAVKHGRGAVELSLRVEGDRVRLAVSDDGPGFPPGFDPCASANTGLELVENVARWDFQGDTAYETRPEGGARVTVTFPVAPDIVRA